MSEFIYRELSKQSQLHDFIDAWERAFDRQLNREAYSWLFGSSLNRIYVAETASSEIAAGYCLLKHIASVNTAVSTTYLCNNVFTTPGYRTHNLFVRLGKASLKDIEGDGNLALGIPNRLSIPGHRRVGWTIYERIGFLQKTTFKLLAPDADIFVQELDVKDLEELEKLSFSLSLCRSFSVVKTVEYFRWRFLERPLTDRKYYIFVAKNRRNLEGYMVLSHYYKTNRLHVLDIDARHGSIIKGLILAMCRFADKNNIPIINLWETTAWRSIFIQMGFSIGDEYSNLIFIEPYKPGDIAALPERNEFNLVLGDNDVF